MRREKRDRCIAPIVDDSQRTILRVELKHRQQFHGSDAELLEIGDLFDQPGIRASVRLIDARTRVSREAAHVHLVDNCARRRLAQWRVSLPIVCLRIDDHAFHCRGRIVAWLAGCLTVIGLGHNDRSAVRIEQHLGGVEPQAALGN